MEQLGSLPSVDAVLNKLKSNGTFDQFRKTCLSSIEGEPSFRAFSEHIEVVSRRYLQNYKWRESTTKNQVRGKLKDHAIGVIAGPDIQVGMPLASVVEKVLETKSKELLPKIAEIIDQLRETRTKAPDSTNSTITQPIGTQSSSKLSNSLASELTKPKLTEFGSLPIDIPGLKLSNNSSKKEPPAATTSTSSSNTDGKTVKGKSKASDVVSSKESRGGGPVKSKSVVAQGTGGSKPAVVKESGKQKDKDKDEKSTSNKGSDEVVSKAAKSSVKPKKVKDEVKDSSVSGQKEEPQENPATTISDSKEKEKNGDKKELETKEQKTTSSKIETKSSKSGQTKGKEKDTSKDKESELNNETNPAVTTTRRSARLASLTESKDDTKKDEGMEGIEQGTEDNPTEVATASLENEPKRKGKKRSRGNRNSTQPAGRKRARMISSSSEDSKEEVSSEDEEQLNKDETRTDVSSTTGKGRRKSMDAPRTKSSRKRPLQHSREEPAQVQHKKPKTNKSNENESKSTTHESTKEEEEHSAEQDTDSKPNKRKSKKPQRLPQRASKSPPVVITRYNRHVKPNRRYLDTSGNDAETKSDDERGSLKEGEAAEKTVVGSDFEVDNERTEVGYSSNCDEEEERTSPPNNEKIYKTKTDRTEQD